MAQKTNTEKSISWRAAEYERAERGPIWYLVVGGATLVLAILALSTGNFFFAVFVILAFVLLISFGRIKPQTFEFRLTEDGIGIGPKIFYNYDAIESFSFNNRPGRLDELILKKKAVFNPYVKIPIDAKTANEAQAFLGERLPATEHKESMIDVFADWLGF